MSDPFGNQPFPRAALIGAGVLLSMTIALAAMGRRTDIGTTRLPPSSIVQQRKLQFEDRSDGGVTVVDASVRRPIALLPPGSNGFLRGVLRGLTHERRVESIGADAPFLLTRWADGRLSISDPATGREVHLEVFGPTNVGAFAQLLTSTDPSREL